MEDCRAVLKRLLIITSVHLSLSDTHTLQYLYTSNGTFTAVGLVDGEQCVYYDSNISKMIPKTEWVKKIEVNYPRYWDRETQRMKYQQDKFQAFMYLTKQRFNHTEGDHTVQKMFGCERDDDNTTREYDQYGYDGEDFISLNLTTGTWTAANDKAERFIKDWDSKGTKAKYWKNYLKTDCIDQLKKFVSLQRKVRPTVSVSHRCSSPSPEVVCHAEGFFPKPLDITWQKDEEDVEKDVMISETLPNQDGSFQRRSILKVPAKELQKHNYTCVVQHSSLEKDLVLNYPEHQIQRVRRDTSLITTAVESERLCADSTGGGSGGKSGGKSGGRSAGAPIAIIVAVVAALIAIVALVVAGIVVWKKKNSGFRPVPPKPSSKGDSSTNNS